MEVVEISREERDVYLIPQNFVDTGTILGGTVKLRNAVEAAVLAVGSAVPLFYLPLAFNIRLMIVIAVSVPLGVFGVVGIGGDSLTQFVAHWFRFMKHRRIVTPTPQGNLEANRHRHLRFISKRYHVVYYDDSDSLPLNAQVLQRKGDATESWLNGRRSTIYFPSRKSRTASCTPRMTATSRFWKLNPSTSCCAPHGSSAVSFTRSPAF